MNNTEKTGIVIIGRNEGARLVRCLASLKQGFEQIVYVDSGSSDDSIAEATKAGAEVINLDMTLPFTAARARNAGVEALINRGEYSFIQFIDGDCTLHADWLATAKVFLSANPGVGAVAGRRRETHPEASVYNRLCDDEWNTPIGEAKACGGDVLMRRDAFQQAGGFNDRMIAGEEPELCVRLRQHGWKIWRLDAEMTYHDANISRIGQWWQRARRSGHAFAEGAALHGTTPERHSVAQTRRILKWTFVPVTSAAVLALFLGGFWWALPLLVYPLQVVRLALRRGGSRAFSWQWAFFLTLGNFAELSGMLDYYWRRLRGRKVRLIEYK